MVFSKESVVSLGGRILLIGLFFMFLGFFSLFIAEGRTGLRTVWRYNRPGERLTWMIANGMRSFVPIGILVVAAGVVILLVDVAR